MYKGHYNNHPNGTTGTCVEKKAGDPHAVGWFLLWVAIEVGLGVYIWKLAGREDTNRVEVKKRRLEMLLPMKWGWDNAFAKVGELTSIT